MNELNKVLIKGASDGNVRFPIIEKSSFMEKSIDELDLNVRAYNALRRNGIKTVSEILDNIDTLPKIRGCGRKTVNDILYKVCCNYYSTLDKKGRESYLQKIEELNRKEEIS